MARVIFKSENFAACGGQNRRFFGIELKKLPDRLQSTRFRKSKKVL